jgi:hypothetical protein
MPFVSSKDPMIDRKAPQIVGKMARMETEQG